MIQIRFSIDAAFRWNAFLRTSPHYRWQRIRMWIADALIAAGLAVEIEESPQTNRSHHANHSTHSEQRKTA